MSKEMTNMKRAFTLIEVTLAVLVMAGGVLGIVSLYSLGLRESSQSVEDVASAGFADAMFAPLVAGLSATNLTWSQWCDAVENAKGGAEKMCSGLSPEKGWASYISGKEIDGGRDFLVEKDSTCRSTADKVANDILIHIPSDYQGKLPSIDSRYTYGLVATRRGSTISLAFRASRRAQQLFTAPVYYTEVHFQGVGQ